MALVDTEYGECSVLAKAKVGSSRRCTARAWSTSPFSKAEIISWKWGPAQWVETPTTPTAPTASSGSVRASSPL